jgi:hypothetical protein
MAVCFQNLPLGALSSHSAPSMLVGALFKKFGLFFNTGVYHWVPAGLAVGVKWQGREDSHAHLSSAEFKHEWRNVANLLYALMSCVGTSPLPC